MAASDPMPLSAIRPQPAIRGDAAPAPPHGPVLLRAEGLRKAFGGQVVLDGLDLDLSRFSLLERRLDLSRLALRGLAVDLARRPAGDLDWAGLLPAAESGEPAPAPFCCVPLTATCVSQVILSPGAKIWPSFCRPAGLGNNE